ncbi:MAG: glycosyltransferase domain-containing protein [Gemmatimonadales bacterium]
MSRWPHTPLIRNRRHGTTPGLVHAPGRAGESPWWPRIEERVLSASHRYRPRDGLEIVTWNSGRPNSILSVRGHRLGTLEASLDRFGIPYTVLGGSVGDRWTNRMKLELTLDHLRRSAAELILGADSADVLLVDDPGRIVDAFAGQPARVLFNAEKNPWPRQLADVASFERQVAPAPFRHLNSGLWIGYREALIEAFGHALAAAGSSEVPGSDQACWKQVYRERYPAIQVDARCRCFQTLNLVRREIVVDGERWPLFAWARPRSQTGPREG